MIERGSPRRIAIFGTGSYTPERVVDNEWFTQFIDTSDEWIVQRTGMHQRRWASEEQTTSDLAVEAARNALDAAGWSAEQLDFILVGTCTPDNLLPNTAQHVHHKLQCRRDCGAIDVINACSSFTYALTLITSMIRSGQVGRALVIGAEKLSCFMNLKDRTSCILFGDAAGAACVGAAPEESRSDILVCRYGTDFDYESLNIAAGGSRSPASHETVEQGDHFVRMNGRAIYKFAVNTLTNEVRGVCEETGIEVGELACIIPHQVNIRIIHSAMENLSFPMERVFVNLDKYGNTSAASVPTAIDEAYRAGYFKRGDLIAVCAFGAGKSWGSQLIRW